MSNFDNGLFIHGDDCVEFVGKIDENKFCTDGDRILESLLEASENFSEEPFEMEGD